MQINLTLFIQIFHFAITYYVLDKLFFGPIIASLNQRELSKKELEQKIELEEDSLIDMEHQKTNNIRAFQDAIKEKYPFEASPKIVSLKSPKIKDDAQDASKLEQEIVDFLEKEVPNAY